MYILLHECSALQHVPLQEMCFNTGKTVRLEKPPSFPCSPCFNIVTCISKFIAFFSTWLLPSCHSAMLPSGYQSSGLSSAVLVNASRSPENHSSQGMDMQQNVLPMPYLSSAPPFTGPTTCSPFSPLIVGRIMRKFGRIVMK